MSIIRRTALVSAFSALAASQATTTPKLDASCEDVVIFMSRGNDAPYHDGRTFPMVTATCDKLNKEGLSCDYIDIQFDVTLGGPYCDQIAEGARNGVSEITAFNAKCPNTHIVVNGYSEGAQVVGDVLGGPGGCTGSSTGIDSNSAAGKAIAAALLWGDVRHTANQPYNVLDGASKEKYPRTGQDLSLLNRYSSVLRSYCAAGDPVCAGGTVAAQHLNYFELYTDDASSWVVSMINKLKGTPSASASASASASVSGSPSGYNNGTATGGYPAYTPGPGYPTGGDNKPSNGGSPSATGPAPGKPTGGAPSYGSPSVSAPAPGMPTGGASKPSNGAQPTSPNSAPAPAGTHPAFPAPVPYDSCVVIYEFTTKYV